MDNSIKSVKLHLALDFTFYKDFYIRYCNYKNTSDTLTMQTTSITTFKGIYPTY